jgi:hypothetical protein
LSHSAVKRLARACKTAPRPDSLWKTLRALKRPGRARTGGQPIDSRGAVNGRSSTSVPSAPPARLGCSLTTSGIPFHLPGGPIHGAQSGARAGSKATTGLEGRAAPLVAPGPPTAGGRSGAPAAQAHAPTAVLARRPGQAPGKGCGVTTAPPPPPTAAGSAAAAAASRSSTCAMDCSSPASVAASSSFSATSSAGESAAPPAAGGALVAPPTAGAFIPPAGGETAKRNRPNGGESTTPPAASCEPAPPPAAGAPRVACGRRAVLGPAGPRPRPRPPPGAGDFVAQNWPPQKFWCAPQ